MRRLIGAAISAKVRGGDKKAIRERVQLAPPRVPALGKAVKAENKRVGPFSRKGDVQSHTVDRDLLMANHKSTVPHQRRFRQLPLSLWERGQGEEK
jgi:hypothetical protein